jgi:hypothetical protein
MLESEQAEEGDAPGITARRIHPDDTTLFPGVVSVGPRLKRPRKFLHI